MDVVDGTVTLRGIVSSPEQKIAAGQIAEDTVGVEQVKNDLKMVLEAGKAFRTAVV